MRGVGAGDALEDLGHARVRQLITSQRYAAAGTSGRIKERPRREGANVSRRDELQRPPLDRQASCCGEHEAKRKSRDKRPLSRSL